MNLFLLALSALSLFLLLAAASPSDLSRGAESRNGHHSAKRADTDSGPVSTVLNGIEVPPMKELTPDNFKETIKDGYWFVKQYSPSCMFCKRLAPTWQKLYERYYTSDPLQKELPNTPETRPINSFTNFYNFSFASMNCLAYGDLCKQEEVRSFPTLALYHNGKRVEQYTGRRSMKALVKFMGKRLELIRTGADTEDDDQPAEDDDGGVIVNGLPNPQGISVPLTAEKFQRLVTSTQDPWFIEFFMPWCGHCRTLAPNWQQMAKEMRNVLNVGEVNCELEPRLCRDARVAGYPTMYFFRGGERVEYVGLRGLGDLISYAKEAVEVGSGVQDVDSATLKELEERDEVIFIYFYDHATTSEDFEALDRLTLSLVGHGRLVKTDSAVLAERFKILTWPRLLVVRDGRPSYYNPISPQDMRDFRQILSWMQTVWLPIVPELTPSNAGDIMNGKYVVLGVLTRRRSDDFNQAKRELKNAALEWMDRQTQQFRLDRQELRDAKQLRMEEAGDRNDQRALRTAENIRITIREDDKKQVGFAWVDGDVWERWLRTTYGIDVENGERIIINDEDNRRYWDTSFSGASIMASRTSILETIPLVIVNPPKLKPKSTVGTIEFVLFVTRSFITGHPVIFLFSLAIFVTVVLLLGRKRMSKRPARRGGILDNNFSNGPGFFRLDGKEGLLSGNGMGKVD